MYVAQNVLRTQYTLLLGLRPTFPNDSGAVLRWILGLMVFYLDSPVQLLPWSSDSENHVSESFSVRIANVSLMPSVGAATPVHGKLVSDGVDKILGVVA